MNLAKYAVVMSEILRALLNQIAAQPGQPEPELNNDAKGDLRHHPWILDEVRLSLSETLCSYVIMVIRRPTVMANYGGLDEEVYGVTSVRSTAAHLHEYSRLLHYR